MKIFPAAAALSLLAAIGATAQTTNTLSDAEIQGRQLAQQLLEQRPAENFTNNGILEIRSNKSRGQLFISSQITLLDGKWQVIYFAGAEKGGVQKLIVVHAENQPNQYIYGFTTQPEMSFLGLHEISADSAATNSFAGSDFWLGDLGLEFLHWPEQKILQGDTARGRLCKVLESTNPNPSTNGYSRVDSWIDNETLGIVEARAYDANGKLLKEFYPKDIKKVNGQWQVGSMEIDNVQTGSRTRLEFDLKAN